VPPAGAINEFLLIAVHRTEAVRPLPAYPGLQDVYRPSTPAASACLKLTVIDAVLIVSFKEL